MITIIADNKEKKCRIIPLLKKQCTVTTKKMDIGDYCLGEDCICERKTSMDFISSIVDGRLFEQLKHLKDIKKPFLIVEGKFDFEKTNMSENAIRGALASVVTDYKIPMLYTQDQRDSASMLFSIAKREQNNKKIRPQVKKKVKSKSKNHEQEILIGSIRGINITLAQNLLNYFKTPKAIFNASIEELKKVEKIGEKKAKQIYNLTKREYEKSILD